MFRYTTMQGDTWDGISYKLYQTEAYMSELMTANPDHIRTVVFSAGIVLQVPEIAAPQAEQLPPWKRGRSG
ncbi:phage tail protein [Xylanibacillus composti]|uniref:Membrane protein n=1 Tax=Xylanibacillus composti TaxID=1572762 RepID=A0A8J4H5K0_9BACL|nr:tail protein X [Xylanibacillus composti]MDT9724269.1 phage tail protein [Xylanibacillus composti]GIQ69264.1 membrane protein [Xylanibacillus composti]